MLTRAPMFLRVTEDRGKFDALNQLEDTARSTEKLYAYEMVGTPGRAFIDGKVSGCFCIADYKLCSIQPDDATLRDNAQWTDWVMTEARRRGLK